MIYSFTQTPADISRFYHDRAERTIFHRVLSQKVDAACREYAPEMLGVRDTGVYPKQSLFKADDLWSLRQSVDTLIAEKRAIGRVRDHAAESREDIQRGEFAFFDTDTVLDPSFVVEERASSVSIKQPLVEILGLGKIVFDPALLGMATAYFDAVPVVSYVKVVRTFPNDIVEGDTQFWHVDFGSYKIFKVFVYLNVVGTDGGPFCYVEWSNQGKFDGWDKQSRYTDEEMHQAYSRSSFVECQSNLGDVWFADTTGFHRGKKPTLGARTAVIITYCVHPEYGFSYTPIKVPESVHRNFDDFQRATADALEWVN